MGVRALTLTSAMDRGMCPARAPTKKMRAEAKMTPLMQPKVEQATKSGIAHAITPIVREAKVWIQGERNNGQSQEYVIQGESGGC